MGSFSHYLQGFVHPRWLFGDFWSINSRGPMSLHFWRSKRPPRYGEIAAAVHVSDKAIVPNVVSAVSWIERWCCLMPQIWCQKELGKWKSTSCEVSQVFFWEISMGFAMAKLWLICQPLQHLIHFSQNLDALSKKGKAWQIDPFQQRFLLFFRCFFSQVPG